MFDEAGRKYQRVSPDEMAALASCGGGTCRDLRVGAFPGREARLFERRAGLKEVVERIVRRTGGGEAARLVEKVKRYFVTRDPADDIGRDDVARLYKGEDYGGMFDAGRRRLDVGWTTHAEYRSELRDVAPGVVNKAVADFVERHPWLKGQRKVELTRGGMGKAVVRVDADSEPMGADVITVMASERTAARTKNKSVEPTAPGSKNRWKVTYWDGQEKWVDARPGRGMPSRRETRLLKKQLNRPSVKRALERLSEAFGKWMEDGKPEPLQQAVERNEVGLDKELAKKVSRTYVKDIRRKLGDGIGDEERKGLQVVTDHVNRGRRDAMDRLETMAGRVLLGFSDAHSVAHLVAVEVLMEHADMAYDAYQSATWTAKWRVEEVDEFGKVSKAKLLGAEGGNDTVSIWLGGVAQEARVRVPEGMEKEVGFEVARLMRGKKASRRAKFGWQESDFEFWNGRGVKPVAGAEFSSNGDSFYRGMEGVADGTAMAAVEVVVVAARYKDDELQVKMVFRTR